MPTMVNPFRGTDPTAQAISDFGNSLFGNTGAGELRKQQIHKDQRENIETERLAAEVAANPDGLAGKLSPFAESLLLLSGYDPAKYNQGALGSAARNFGAMDQRTQDAQIGAGQSYDNTYDAFSTKQNEVARQYNQTPIAALDGEGKSVFGRQGDLGGLFPVLSEADRKGTLLGNNWGGLDKLSPEQRNVLGANQAQGPLKTFVGPDGVPYTSSDGITDVHGRTIPIEASIRDITGSAAENGLSLTAQNLGEDQDFIRQADDYSQLATLLRQQATEHPENLGIIGAIRGGVQEIAQNIPALQKLFGSDIGKTINDTANSLASSPETANMFAGLVGTYEGGLPTVKTLGVMLKYKLGSLLLGQSGRGMTDKDLEQIDKMLPDAQGIFSSANSVITTLNLFDNIISTRRNAAAARLQAGGKILPDQGLPDLPAPENLSNTPAAPAAEEVVVYEGDPVIGPDGKKYVVRNNLLEPR